jgi:hypothetical protein
MVDGRRPSQSLSIRELQNDINWPPAIETIFADLAAHETDIHFVRGETQCATANRPK